MNTAPVSPFVLGQRFINDRPDSEFPDVGKLVERIKRITPDVFALDATAATLEMELPRSLNMLMVGCLVGTALLPCSAEEFWRTVEGVFPPKLVAMNEKPFRYGVEFGRTRKLVEVCR